MTSDTMPAYASMSGATSVPPKKPAMGMAIWNRANMTGIASFLDAGISGSQSELDSVTAMASIASATPRTTA